MPLLSPRRTAATLICVAAVGAASVSCMPPTGSTDSADSADGLTVLAAASTRVLNDELQGLGDAPATIINAGSPSLVQQLADGGPGDVLITADKKTMDDAVKAGVAMDPVEVASNEMVLVTQPGNPKSIAGIDDLFGKNVVTCDPQVPCGAVAEALMKHNDVDLDVASLESSVTDALGKVTSKQADAAFVYRSDAQAAGKTVTALDIPGADTHRNKIMAAVTHSSGDSRQAAQDFVDALDSPAHDAMWTSHGFTPSS